MTTYYTITDLAHHVADTLGLDQDQVLHSLETHRRLWGRYEDITPAQVEVVAQAVWSDVTEGAEYPW